MRLGLAIAATAWMAGGAAFAQIPADHTPPIDAAGVTYFQQRFLIQGFHRAFAISADGKWAGWLGSNSIDRARDEALNACLKKASKPCAIYALNGYIVAGGDLNSVPRYADAPKLGRFIPSDYYPVRGPAKAKGLIVWSHGYFRGIDATTTQPHGYVSRFHKDGWDVYRYNREWVDQLHSDVQGMIDSVAAAKQAGYRTVILAGQSQGAWVSLAALGDGVGADGVIATAMARHGAPPTSGARSDFRELLRRIRGRNAATPVVFSLFENDTYDPGGRFADIPDILGGTQVPFHVIDRPKELPGHGAGANLKFNDRFGACIERFVTSSPPTFGDCK